jgi:hypothetical protein
MPRGTSLYGSLPQQLQDPNSFAARLRDILAVRTRYSIATAVQVEVPEVSNKAMLVMIHLLDTRQVQVTVLNFSSQSISGSVKSQHLAPGNAVTDMLTDQVIAEVDHEHTFAVSLEPHQGRSLLTDPADAPGPPSRRQPIDEERASGTEKV